MGGTRKRSSRKTMRRGRKAPSSRAKKLYRKRVKGSKCRGMMTAKCRHSKQCKMALGKKRSFCRKAGNTKRRRSHLRKTMKGGSLKGFGHHMHTPYVRNPGDANRAIHSTGKGFNRYVSKPVSKYFNNDHGPGGPHEAE